MNSFSGFLIWETKFHLVQVWWLRNDDFYFPFQHGEYHKKKKIKLNTVFSGSLFASSCWMHQFVSCHSTEFVLLSLCKKILFPSTRQFPKAFWERPWTQLEKGKAQVWLKDLDLGHVQSAQGWKKWEEQKTWIESRSASRTDSMREKQNHLQQKGILAGTKTPAHRSEVSYRSTSIH